MKWSKLSHFVILYSILTLGALWFLFVMVLWICFIVFGVGDPESDLRLFPGM